MMTYGFGVEQEIHGISRSFHWFIFRTCCSHYCKFLFTSKRTIGAIFASADFFSALQVPFILVDNKQQPISDYGFVDLNGSKHPLPLITVYHQMPPIQASPFTFTLVLFGHEYPIGLIDEDKVLPLGKDVTAFCVFFPIKWDSND